MKFLLALSLLFSLTSGFSDEVKSEGAQNINNACAADAKLAGCEGEKVGTGLLKCLTQFKKLNKKEFKLSDACKDSIKTYREERKAKKEAKKEERKAKRKERKAKQSQEEKNKEESK